MVFEDHEVKIRTLVIKSDDGTVTTLYHKGPYLYFVVFDNHVSVLEKYSRVDGAGLSEKEIAKFLKANAGRTVTWIRDETATSKDRRFKRSDDKAEATYGKMDGRLTLTLRVVGREKESTKRQAFAILLRKTTARRE